MYDFKNWVKGAVVAPEDINRWESELKTINEDKEVTNETISGLDGKILDTSVVISELGVNTNKTFGEVNKKIEGAEKTINILNNIDPGLQTLFKAPTMPDTLKSKGSVPDSYEPDVNLAALMDPLVDGKYVTKRSLGKEQSGTYDVWCYEFTPEKPEKTILLTTSIHGNEYTGFYWITQFLNMLVNQWQEYPHFAYLRKNVRVVAVPIVNPWGHKNQKRYNSREVDLSRNFDYNWGTSFDEYNQGESVWSEAEARIMRDLMAEIADDCVATLDFHTTLSEGDTHHILYYPRWLKNNITPYLSIIDEIMLPGETSALASTTLPTMTNWGVFKHGFNGANPEFKNGLSGTSRSSIEMTRAMNFFGNMVFQAATRTFKNKALSLSDHSVQSLKFDHRTDGGTINFSSPTYTSQTSKTAVKFDIKNEGTFEVDGFITLTATEDAEVSILPHLYQVYSPDFSFAKTSDDEFNSTIFKIKAGDEKIIPIQAEITCHKTSYLAKNNTNQRAQEAVFQLRTKISNGSASIKFVKARTRFTPSTNGDRFQRYGMNPARIVYPNGQETAYAF